MEKIITNEFDLLKVVLRNQNNIAKMLYVMNQAKFMSSSEVNKAYKEFLDGYKEQLDKINKAEEAV